MKRKRWYYFINPESHKPQMINVGCVARSRFAYAGRHPDKAYNEPLSPEMLEGLISELQSKGYNAVDINSPQAADPAALLVSPFGVRTPLLAPDQLRKSVYTLMTDLENSAYVRPLSYPLPRTLESFGDLVDDEAYRTHPEYDYYNRWKSFSAYRHPNPEKLKEIFMRHGQNFVRDMVTQAYNERKSTDWMKKLTSEFKVERENIVFGGCSYARDEHTQNPYNHNPGRSAQYLTPNIEIAVRFSGMQYNNPPDPEMKFSFVHAFIGYPHQKFVPQYGLEAGSNKGIAIKDAFESVRDVERNTRLYSFIIFDNGETCYEIKEEKPEWSDFMEVLRIGYMPLNDYERQNYEAYMQQIAEYGAPSCYDVYGNMPINEERLRKLHAMELEHLKELTFRGETELLEEIKRKEKHDLTVGMKQLRQKARKIFGGPSIDEMYARDMAKAAGKPSPADKAKTKEQSNSNAADIVESLRRTKENKSSAPSALTLKKHKDKTK